MNVRLLIVSLTALLFSACGGSDPGQNDGASAEPETEQTSGVNEAAESVEIVPGLTHRVLRAGDGEVAQVGQTAVVHYTGWLYDESTTNLRGNKFDSSLDRNQHFEFEIGGGRVISGWDQGVVGMRIGELRELTIAPELAYGNRQVGALIPAGSTLVFEVELAGLKGGDEPAAESP